MSDLDPVGAFEEISSRFADARSGLQKVIFGQEEVIELTLAVLAAGGHGLLVGAPGLAKTLLVTSVAELMGLSAKRVQFTPDLMPGDVLGSEVLEESADGKRAFRFIPGPIFCQLLMADEINRASPRTQSALLQAMQELHVTVAGARHDLPSPFHVLATQNPIEQEGTYPLPEAQLDRFLLQINVGYPDEDAERRMLAATTGARTAAVEPALTPGDLKRAQRLVREMPIGEQIVDAILSLVRRARPTGDAEERIRTLVAWGPGPRASQALSLSARALALIDGRFAPSLDDVRRLAKPVLRHRMALNFSARSEGLSTDDFIDELLAKAF
ncbi:AAA family ATPase [Amphiplicatus metriothermophilus]|uniref:MoxR-like ATPase n=1 Tax=Amphiplicatus metriothermophilus TaxID=1519374 RepID=A0A239PTA6_9PROT|nr:MoxR family ATPase [Amphiplicatus metriothermophilus]MBB5519092.1 MoxR-like ATPase [Amphiplicatus metriothermophilus]SNT73162.1 MoxR-like ATPase [Amphiplicatus metriothermophilus]